MGSSVNRKIILASRPKGMPDESNFTVIKERIPEIKEGDVLIRTIYLSVDPYMRGRMSNAISYAKPYELEEPILGGVVGRVVDSKNSRFQVGEYIEGRLDWADYNVSDGKMLRKVNPELAPVSTALHVLGMPGLTAYFGLLYIGEPKEGETVVVSGASGAVGMIVGQIAKLKGCRVVGIAGTDEKCSYITEELGFDAAVNYKNTENLETALKSACPDGVDVYFDNVGGVVSDSILSLINFQSRIIICGQISQYNLENPTMGTRVGGHLLKNSAMMKGFIVSDYEEHNEEGLAKLSLWLREGKIQYRENVVIGFENTINAFLGLFRGDNIGKQLVKVTEE
ncbi:MAG: NADP-dependent oxidoreductase [Bacillota bacterium]